MFVLYKYIYINMLNLFDSFTCADPLRFLTHTINVVQSTNRRYYIAKNIHGWEQK